MCAVAVAVRAVRVVQRPHVERRARRAILLRLGYVASNAVISVARDPDRRGTVILHVNSVGNAFAATTALRDAGYQVEDTDYDPSRPGNYGVRLRVLPGDGDGR